MNEKLEAIRILSEVRNGIGNYIPIEIITWALILTGDLT